jgi:hypothetical protein
VKAGMRFTSIKRIVQSQRFAFIDVRRSFAAEGDYVVCAPDR